MVHTIQVLTITYINHNVWVIESLVGQVCICIQ